MNRLATQLAVVLVVVAGFVAIGELTGPDTPASACRAAVGGHGSLGACTPKAQRHLAGAQPPAAFGAYPTYPDLSNNDPLYNMRAVARAGHPAVYLKVNQGTGFVDRTFVPMARAAIAAGLAPGGYDFAERYDAAEAYLFISRLHAAGQYRATPGWLPPTLDVEYGQVNRGGLQTMINILFREYGRVNIYTGGWYWTPHLGCFWPANVTGWLSGYPFAPKLCGQPAALYSQHQYTDQGYNGVFSADMNVYLGTAGQFRAFAHLPQPVVAKPKPRPRPKPKRNLPLERAVALRARLRVDRPRDTLEGAAVNRVIARLHGPR